MASDSDQQPQVHVPLDYPTSLIYMDESGSAANGRIFVVGALKVRRHGVLARSLRAVRDATGADGEFRFNRVNRTTSHHFTAMLDTLREADTFFAATIVDRDVCDPEQGRMPAHRAHAEIASRLLRGCINRRELVSVSMDMISTPPDVAMEDDIARAVNRRLGHKAIVTAALLDSKTCDCLQLVDVLTSAVACDYRQKVGVQPNVSAHKRKVVEHAKLVLGVTEFIGRGSRTNVMVYLKRQRTGSVVHLNKRRVG